MQKIRLGTRGSKLALWQSRFIKGLIEDLPEQQFPDGPPEIELVILKTEGDVAVGPLNQQGGQGLFTKRIQQALLTNEIDIAVHSLKDLPSSTPPGLILAATPPRADVRDALLSLNNVPFEQLPPNARVGTGSNRRRGQLQHLRPDLEVVGIRGNLDTRIEKMEAGKYDAIILAKAGLDRLGWASKISQVFETEQMLPAAGQGALGIETRQAESKWDSTVSKLVSNISCSTTFAAVTAERSLLHCLNAGCSAPVGGLGTVNGDQLELTGVVLSLDGKTRLSFRAEGHIREAASLGAAVAEGLLNQGAKTLMET